MSQSVVIDMDTPTVTDPRLNLTARVQNIQHLLDGESDITQDENIPSHCIRKIPSVHEAMEKTDQLRTQETVNQ